MDNLHLNQHLLILFVHLLAHTLIVENSPKLRGKGLSHLHRLADARTLDDHVLHLGGPGETCEFGQQIAPERTADAAILELDEFLFGLGDVVVCD